MIPKKPARTKSVVEAGFSEKILLRQGTKPMIRSDLIASWAVELTVTERH
jgi:hypothetical protein